MNQEPEKEVWIDHFGDWKCPACNESNDGKYTEPNKRGEFECKNCAHMTELKGEYD